MNLDQKEAFYYELGRLARSGISFPRAIETLVAETRGEQRRVLRGIQMELEAGKSVGEAFAKQSPAIGKLESTIISASERSGRMEMGCDYLESYFGMLGKARRMILRASAYPLFVLHFGILVGSIRAVFASGLSGYLLLAGTSFVVFWAGFAALLLVSAALNRLGRVHTRTDRILRNIPLIGKVRRNLSLARFCATYNMNLNAGLNVMESLRGAGDASQSAAIQEAARCGVEGLRRGEQLSAQLGKHSVFPQGMVRAIRIGEDTGELEKELARLAADFQERGFVRLETVAEWVPRLLYVGVMLYVAYQIIALYWTVLQSYDALFE